MRKFFPVILLVLASCATVRTPADMTLVQKVRAGIASTCHYQAAIDSIIQVLGTFQPGANLISLVIDTICAAVAPLAVGHAGPRTNVSDPVVNGVVIHGHFVSRKY